MTAGPTLDPSVLLAVAQTAGFERDALVAADCLPDRLVAAHPADVQSIVLPDQALLTGAAKAYGDAWSLRVVDANEDQLLFDSADDTVEEARQRIAERLPGSPVDIRLSLEKARIAAALFPHGDVRPFLFADTITKLLDGDRSRLAAAFWADDVLAHAHIVVGDRPEVLCEGPLLRIFGTASQGNKLDPTPGVPRDRLAGILSQARSRVRMDNENLLAGLTPWHFSLSLGTGEQWGPAINACMIQTVLGFVADRVISTGDESRAILEDADGKVEIPFPSSLTLTPRDRRALLGIIDWIYTEMEGSSLADIRLPIVQARYIAHLQGMAVSQRAPAIAELAPRIFSASKHRWRSSLTDGALAELSREASVLDAVQDAVGEYETAIESTTDSLLDAFKGVVTTVIGAFVAAALNANIAELTFRLAFIGYAAWTVFSGWASLARSRQRLAQQQIATARKRSRFVSAMGEERVAELEEGRPAKLVAQAEAWRCRAKVGFTTIAIASLLAAIFLASPVQRVVTPPQPSQTPPTNDAE